jgi:Glycosyl transferase family 11
MVVSLSGGLGNQMFQYAFGRSLSIARHEEVLFNRDSYANDKLRHYELDCFNLDMKFAYPAEPFYCERNLLFHDVPRAGSYKGYWQTEKYFNRDTVLREFSVFRGTPNKACEEMAFRIMSSEACFIGVRRTDYLWPERIGYHGALDRSYYYEAMLHIPEGRWFIFTDDIEWAEDNLMPFGTIVDVNGPDEKHWDIWLMSLCKHAIIANSTFHWWGAYLGPDMTGKVIAPKQWFAADIPNEIVPDRWIKV